MATDDDLNLIPAGMRQSSSLTGTTSTSALESSAGTATAALYRGWVSVKGSLSGCSDHDMPDECERAEDMALARYRKARKQSLPPSLMALVEKQSEAVQRNHDQIHAMRNALLTINHQESS